MSNLSELLPAGAGAKSADFVASGTLGSGVTVALKTDGTVEAVSGSVTSGSLGSLTQFNSSNSVYVASAYHAAQNKIVVAYGNGGNSDYGTACVGTISGTSITFGTPVVFLSAEARYIAAVYDPDNEKIVIAYADSSDVDRGKARVGTVSGSSISFGTQATYASSTAGTSYTAMAYDEAENKVIIAGRYTSNYGYVWVSTVSGTSISFGSPVQFNLGTTDMSVVYDSSNQKIVISYNDDSNASYGTAIVGTVSGTSISFGTEVVFESANSQYIATTFDSTSGKILIAYRDVGNASYGTAIVGTVSGTAITFGTAVVFAAATTINITASYSPLANVTNFAYTDNGNTSRATYITGTVSGTTISFDTEASLEPSNGDYFSSASIGSGKVFFGYRSGTTGEGIVLQNGYTVTNNADFIGITDEAISSAASGSVIVQGGVSDKVTGLTANTDYYVQANGTISTTVSTVPAGRALSTSSILLEG